MPYYVFKMSSPEGMELVKNLELIDNFESFREAKNFAKTQRAELDKDDKSADKSDVCRKSATCGRAVTGLS